MASQAADRPPLSEMCSNGAAVCVQAMVLEAPGVALALAGCVFLLLVLLLRSAMPRSDQTSAPRPGWKELCPPSFKIREPTPANPRAWKAGMMRRIGQTFTLKVG